MVLSSSPATSSTLESPTHNDIRHSVFNVAEHITNVSHVSGSEAKELLATLKPLDRTGYYVEPCMEGTRENILQEIMMWVDDFYASNTLWITGSPGSGKSTIASSLVSRLTKCSRLGSSFAFKRGDILRSDPASLWRTVAHDLTRNDASYTSIMVEVLKSGTVDPGRPDIASHFESLIKMPLTKRHEHSPSSTIVIVIDALDECGSDSSQEKQRRALLDTIAQWSLLPGTFKLIVTGRNDRLTGSFRNSCKLIELPTGAEVDMDANQDIRRFFVKHFDEIGGSFLVDWPGEKVLDTLTTQAAGLFIWADTVIRFVQKGLPEECIERVLRGDLGGGDNVTQLYRQVLELAFGDADSRTLKVFNHVVTAIILAKIPFHPDGLARFLSQPKASVNFILKKLSSVISVVDDSRICIKHVLFAEFMCDPQRCPPQFYIDCNNGSQDMLITCFQLMKTGLKFNICDLTTSHLANRDVVDLSKRIAEKIQYPLLYSCRFWAAHLQDTLQDTPPNPIKNVDLITEVKDFFHFRFLYWLEVMSVIEEVTAANIALLVAAPLVQVSNFLIEVVAETKVLILYC